MNHYLFISQGAGSPTVWFFFAYFFMALVFIFFPLAYLTSYFERKLSADFQARVGPSLTGRNGILQILADHLKLFQKNLSYSKNFSGKAWLALSVCILYASLAVLPLGTELILFTSEVSLLFPVFLFLFFFLAQMMLGIRQGSVSGFFGGIRLSVQAVSGAFPLLITVATVALARGSLSWEKIVLSQAWTPSTWILFESPFLFLAGLSFYLSGLLMLHLEPLNSAMASKELQGGVFRSSGGKGLALFRVNQAYLMVFWTMLFSAVFLGGWNTPDLLNQWIGDEKSSSLQFFQLGWFIAKSFCVIVLLLWQRKVIPLLRIDQVTDYSWKVLSPLSIFAFFGQTIWMGVKF